MRKRNILLMCFCLLCTLLAMSPRAGAAQFTAASYPVTVSGTQSTSIKFTVGGSTVTCTTATSTGELTSASETIRQAPTFSGCTAFGFIGATVTGMNGGPCDWVYSGSGLLAIACTSGDVQIDAGPCTATIEASKNTSLKNVTYTNNTPAAGQVTLDINVTNLHSVITTSDFGCPVAKGTYTNGTVTGTYIWKGSHGGGSVSIDVGF
jgi:hypothetical protein